MSTARWAHISLVLLIAAMALPLFPLSGEVEAASELPPPSAVALPQYGNVTISLYVINVYDFQYKTGSYTFDFYLELQWTDSNITYLDWYLMNGMPSYPGAKNLVFIDNTSAVRSELWRVRADLSVPIMANEYPFDTVDLPISIELLTPYFNTSLQWDRAQSGVDPAFKIVGWDIIATTYVSGFHVYTLKYDEPQAVMTITLVRSPMVGFINTILPPLIFCIVSAFSFFLRLDESGSFSLRIGMNTSMIITAVLFNISENGQIPPVTDLSFYSLYFVAVLCFLAGNLLVTMVEYIYWKRGMSQPRMRNINFWGALACLVLPAILIAVAILSLSPV
ncbi:MAG: hypothetical protein WCK39_03955 [Methanomassiliicoccales archaeon]